MARLLILLILVLAALWFVNWLRRTPSSQVRQKIRKPLLWGLVGLLVLAVLTGRLNPLLALFAAALPLLNRLIGLVRFWPLVQQVLRLFGLAAPGQAGRIRSRYLEMELDPDSGVLDGLVLDGPFRGRRLASLGLDDLRRMHEFYRESDPRSARLLESYLERERGQDRHNRDSAGSSDKGRGRPGNGKLSRSEAYAILGLAENADAETIRAAHRRLIQRLHPDRGGSDYLAARINEARHVLLGD